jgi:hypothetical protein
MIPLSAERIQIFSERRTFGRVGQEIFRETSLGIFLGFSWDFPGIFLGFSWAVLEIAQ